MSDSYVNEEYFKKISQREKVWHFSSDPNTAKFSYDRLIRHLSAARIQMQRITENIALASSPQLQEPELSDIESVKKYFEEARNNYEPIFIDIHFYFVAWVNCQSMMKTLSSLPEFKEAKVYYQSIRKHFDNYGEARNTFEHFHDRLPAGKHNSRVKEVQEPNAGPRKVFGGLNKGNYIFSDKSWDITPSSCEQLEKLVGGFIELIHCSANEACDEFLKKA